MLRRSLTPLALVAVIGLAGCTAGGGDTDSSSRFTGAQAQVAEVVEDLQEAGERKDAERICTQVLSRSLVQELSSAGTSCQQEMTRAIADATDFDLSVQRVAVSGASATAVVRRGDAGRTATLRFVREDGRWKADALGGAASTA